VSGLTFVDPIAGDECVLHVLPTEPIYNGGLLVDHAGCDELGDVTVELDAWFCAGCDRSGRISGAWAFEQYRLAGAARG